EAAHLHAGVQQRCDELTPERVTAKSVHQHAYLNALLSLFYQEIAQSVPGSVRVPNVEEGIDAFRRSRDRALHGWIRLLAVDQQLDRIARGRKDARAYGATRQKLVEHRAWVRHRPEFQLVELRSHATAPPFPSLQARATESPPQQPAQSRQCK